jgi:HSP20 family protein
MAEEFRTDEKMMIAAEVPGLRAERDISVTVTSDVLRIRAGRGDIRVPETDLRDGVFSRDIRLPSGVDRGNIRASYLDPILQVDVPMSASDGSTRTVTVTTGVPGGDGSGA